jgi:putative endopeptidase
MTFKLLFVGALCVAPACLADFDPKNMDTSVKPSVDFYDYAVGTWLKNTNIPADHASMSAADIVNDRNQAILHALAEKAASDPNADPVEKLVGDFYFSGMNVEAANAAGITPLKSDLDQIAAMATTADLPAEVAKLHHLGAGVCFGLGSEPDPKNSDMVITGMGQGGLGLPERDYYLRTNDESKKLRDLYTAHVTKMFGFAGDSPADAAEEAAAVMRIETALAESSKKVEDLRDPVANYHPMPVADLQKLAPHFDWSAYLAALGLPNPSVIDVGQPDFIKGLDAEIAKAPLSDWKAYFRWQLIHANARYLSAAFLDENFNFYSKILAGVQTARARWMRVLYVIDENIGDALGQLYVKDNFPPEAKARVLAMVANIRATLRERIQALEWMDDATKAKALAKLDAYGVKVGYPDKWIDYSTLKIDRGPYVLNVERATEFLVKRDLAKIGKPTDRSLWDMTAPTVNCYYSPTGNEVVFAAGYLQPPFFDRNADDALNYGAVGAVMGHEMTHGFDDEGRQFDPKGNLTDWWTPESAKRFKERANLVVKQYSEYVPVGDLHINGQLDQGENIADIGGAKISFHALEKTLAGKPQVLVDGFTPEQRFFLSFADMYRDKETPEVEKYYLQTDPHSPDKYRVIGVLSNMDEFAKAFDVPEGAPMRRAPADRVNIW